MALTNDSIIQIVSNVLNKDMNGQSFTPKQYEQMINTQSLRLFKRKLGLPEEYQKDIPIAQEGVGTSQKIDNDLLPFLHTTALAATGGVISLSGLNAAYIASMTPNPHLGRGFDLISLYELPERTNNAITFPTQYDPVIVRSGLNTMTIYPITLTGATISYYSYPALAVVAYTRNATTLRPEYDSGNSVELEWDDMNKVDIAYMILRDAGMNIERRDVTQYADQLIKSGK